MLRRLLKRYRGEAEEEEEEDDQAGDEDEDDNEDEENGEEEEEDDARQLRSSRRTRAQTALDEEEEDDDDNDAADQEQGDGDGEEEKEDEEDDEDEEEDEDNDEEAEEGDGAIEALPVIKFPSNTCSIATCPAPQDRKTKLIVCGQCGAAGHQKCLLFADKLFAAVHTYSWQCIECKTCSACERPGDDDHLMLCDQCDRGYHTYCVDPPFAAVPDDSWVCERCESGMTDKDIERFFAKDRSNFSRVLQRSIAGSASALANKGSKVKKEKQSTKKEKRLERRLQKRTGSSPPAENTDNEAAESDEGLANGLPSSIKKSHKGGRKPGFKLQKWPEDEGGKPQPIVSLVGLGPDEDESFDSYAVKRFKQDDPTSSLDPLPVDVALRPYDNDMELFRQAVEETRNEYQTRRIKRVHFGQKEMDTIYNAPLPEEFRKETIYMCEFCLKPLTGQIAFERHQIKCQWRHPPGDEIYRKGSLSVFEVDGKKAQMYCQNLCMLAKMFLDHKTLLYDVEPFLFYVLTEYEDNAYHLVGYFSKEKRSLINNLCCIVVLPIFQRKGIGQWLIDFSYLLTKREHRTGAPERPLSSLGNRSYQLYWKRKIVSYLLRSAREVADMDMTDVCSSTGITASDVKETLESLGFALKRRWGGHQQAASDQRIIVDLTKLQTILQQLPAEDVQNLVDPDCLRWTPWAA